MSQTVKKVPKVNIKGDKMTIDFLNSKAEKAYHWGVKTTFIIEKVSPFWGLGYVTLSVSCGKGKSKCG